MKAIYALAFVCMSLHAFTASADTLDDSTAAYYPSFLGYDDLDIRGRPSRRARPGFRAS